MENLVHWIRYSHLFPFGSVRPRKLLEQLGSLELLDQCGAHELALLGMTKEEISRLHRFPLDEAKRILERCEALGIWLLPFDAPEYPQRLRNIYNPPMLLYGKGSLGMIDEEPAITVVGTRTASPYGIGVTQRLCQDLAKAGFTILSGCAVGIDGAAHSGALSANGKTIAVLGCGVDVDYPQEHQKLKERILERGALISELPPGAGISKTYFPIRNRILSALSVGVLVTEAPVRSGAKITANCAVEQGKDLFCVPPHDIFDSSCAGVVPYLRDGAKAVYSAEDILMEYCVSYPHKLDAQQLPGGKGERTSTEKVPPEKAPTSQTEQADQAVQSLQQEPLSQPEFSDPEEQKLYSILKDEPQSADELAAAAGYSISRTLELLMDLELAGLAVSFPGQKYRKKGAF